jgi:hypothetical protein
MRVFTPCSRTLSPAVYQTSPKAHSPAQDPIRFSGTLKKPAGIIFNPRKNCWDTVDTMTLKETLNLNMPLAIQSEHSITAPKDTSLQAPQLIIAPFAQFKGTAILTDKLVVYKNGRVNGNLTAEEVHHDGVFNGIMTAQGLGLNLTGYITGNCTIKTEAYLRGSFDGQLTLTSPDALLCLFDTVKLSPSSNIQFKQGGTIVAEKPLHTFLSAQDFGKNVTIMTTDEYVAHMDAKFKKKAK